MRDIITYKSNWNYPTTITFGVGRIAELPMLLTQYGVKHPLLVTDPGLAALPIVDDLLKILRTDGFTVSIFSNFVPNPNGKNVEDGVRAYRETATDGVIAFGGGSALDVGKAIAFMSAQSRPLWDFEDVGDNYLRASTDGLPPVIAIPTTAGTGSEVGRASVITNDATHTKTIIFHPRMLPGTVILDPELTLGLPRTLTAATGMDALAHALEAYCSPFFHPMANGIAVEAMRLIKEWLPVAVSDGQSLEARANMLAASSMGAAAFQKGLGAIHSLSHPLGAIYNLHHGTLNAVVMPYVLVYNRGSIAEDIGRLAAYLEIAEPSFDTFLHWILRLREEIGIPHTLAAVGVGEDRLDALSVMAEADPSTGTNPLRVGAKDFRRMFEMAIRGELAR
jgi:alcohol dehydrogenase class IV